MTSHHLPRNSPMEVRNALFSRNSSRRRRRPDCATTPLRARDPAGRPGTRAMFSTRRRRRALVLVGIGYVGVPVAHVPRVESFNGSTFPPPPSGPLWGRSHVTDARVDFSALSRDAHASSPSITPLDARAARARRWLTARASRTSPASRRTRRGMPSRKWPPPTGRRRSKRRSGGRRGRAPDRDRL